MGQITQWRKAPGHQLAVVRHAIEHSEQDHGRRQVAAPLFESCVVSCRSLGQQAEEDAAAIERQYRQEVEDHDHEVGDDTRLRQVLGNLVRNALVHTPSQTPIDVKLSTEDSIARLSVADHGSGLPAEDADRIFEPFYRADPSRSRDSGGAGLGLSIVHDIVTGEFGGAIEVDSAVGRGTTFKLSFPRPANG